MVLLPGGLFRFTLPKLTALAVGVLLAAVASRTGRVPRIVAFLVAAGSAVLLVATLASQAPVAQLLGRWPRYEGLVALPVYVGTVWAGARLLGPRCSPRAARVAILATAVAGAGVGAVSVLETLGLHPLGGDVARPGSLLGNATDQGIVGMLVVATILPYIVLARRGDVPARQEPAYPGTTLGRGHLSVAAVGGIGGLSALELSGSRGALVGTAAALAVQAIVVARSRLIRRDRVRAVLGIALLGAVVVAAAMAVPGTRDRLLDTTELAAQTVEGRALLWRETAGLVLTHPALGVGPSGFVDSIPDLHTEEWARATDAENPPDSPHSWAFQAAAAGGVPLLVLAVTLACAVLVSGGRNTAQAWPDNTVGTTAPIPPGGAPPARWTFLVGCTGACFGYGVALATHFTTAGTVGLAGLLAGALIATAPPSAQAEGATRRRAGLERVAIGIVFGAWALLLGIGSAAEVVLARAVTSAARGDVGEANARFELAQRLRPWDLDLPLIAAQVFSAGANAGHRPSAEAASSWADMALSTMPASLEAARVRATARIALDDADGAGRALSALLDRAPYDARLLLASGVAHAQLGEWHAAEIDLLEAARYAPADPIVWQNLAAVYSATGRSDDAMAALERASGGTDDRGGG